MLGGGGLDTGSVVMSFEPSTMKFGRRLRFRYKKVDHPNKDEEQKFKA